MILYSITIYIKKGQATAWLAWMKKKHIPDVMSTGLFQEVHFFKNLYHKNTYTIQYELDNIDNYKKY